MIFASYELKIFQTVIVLPPNIKDDNLIFMNDLRKQAYEFISLLEYSKYAVVFTGAGISTDSGIPDYRTPKKGIWENFDKSVVSLEGFLKNPSRYYSYALELHPIRSFARPNSAHYMLAKFEEKGLLRGIITQNVDGLHYDAGSRNVYELHGSLREFVCLSCYTHKSAEGMMERVKNGENPPRCKKCNGILKPNAVFFGEALPRIPWEKSVELVNNADLFISIGSSLQVSPANNLPRIAIKNNAKFIIINLMDTPYDNYTDLLIKNNVSELSKVVLDILQFNH